MSAKLTTQVLCTVLRPARDATNGGVTSAARCPGGYVVLLPEDAEIPTGGPKGTVYLRVAEAPAGGGPIAVPADPAEDVGKAGPMYGGNWVVAEWNRDWPFPGPIRVHDRYETWEQYDRLSR